MTRRIVTGFISPPATSNNNAQSFPAADLGRLHYFDCNPNAGGNYNVNIGDTFTTFGSGGGTGATNNIGITLSVTNNPSGLFQSNAIVSMLSAPFFSHRYYINIGPANMRSYLGLTDRTNAADMFTSDNPLGNFIGFRYSTSAGDTTWKCVSKNGSTNVLTVLDSGIPIVVKQVLKFCFITNPLTGAVDFYIGVAAVGNSMQKVASILDTTFLPVNTVNMRLITGANQIAGTGNQIVISRMWLIELVG